MKKFEYGVYDAASNKMPVSLNGYIQGYIRANAWGWFFASPTEPSTSGKLFPTVQAIKSAIESAS